LREASSELGTEGVSVGLEFSFALFGALAYKDRSSQIPGIQAPSQALCSSVHTWTLDIHPRVLFWMVPEIFGAFSGVRPLPGPVGDFGWKIRLTGLDTTLGQ
jgi:hypothetical protein